MEYTKGKWIVVHEFNVESDGQRGIASCGYSDNRDPDNVAKENIANAHLIAAAPAMYEALTHLTNRFKTAAMMSGLSLDYIEGELEESLKALAQAGR